MEPPAASPIAPEQLALLDQVIHDVAQRSLPPEHASDFAQTVHVRFLQRNYDIFSRFSGRSSLRTYLTVVVTRQLLDWRNAHFGKWRPSAAARRLGGHAIRLDRLINRDELPLEEALQTVGNCPGSPSMDALRHLAAQLPRRTRQRLVSVDGAECGLTGRQFDDPVAAREEQERRRLILARLGHALRRLAPHDRALVKARFYQKVPMRVLGPTLKSDPKALYRRLEKVLLLLRSDLTRQGVVDSSS